MKLLTHEDSRCMIIFVKSWPHQRISLSFESGRSYNSSAAHVAVVYSLVLLSPSGECKYKYIPVTVTPVYTDRPTDWNELKLIHELMTQCLFHSPWPWGKLSFLSVRWSSKCCWGSKLNDRRFIWIYCQSAGLSLSSKNVKTMSFTSRRCSITTFFIVAS